MKSGGTFLLGLLVGLGTGLLIHRLREVVEEDRPERVVDKLSHSLEELERRASQLEARINHN